MKILEMEHLNTAPPAIWNRLYEQMYEFYSLGFVNRELRIVIGNGDPYVTVHTFVPPEIEMLKQYHA